MRRTRSLLPDLALIALLASACASPVGVRPADPREVQRELGESVLTGDRPSAPTRELLTRLNLGEPFHREPDATLDALHRGLEPSGDMDRLYALAELSLRRAEQTRDRGRAFAAAVYAYAFLFDARNPPGRFDPRFAVARQIYNRGLTRGLASGGSGGVLLASGSHPLPFGVLDVELDPAELLWAGFRLEGFVSVDALRIYGLDNRYRDPGIGAPLSATIGERVDTAAVAGEQFLPASLRVPATAFLRIEDPRAQIASGRVSSGLELYWEDERLALEIGEEVVPLELEKSSSIALMLEGASIWDWGFRGFRLGDFLPAGQAERLLFLRPFGHGRIPLVLVHGTFSSPATWAQLVNELQNDREISQRYQIWLFLYNSGNPIGYSAGILAETLRGVVTYLDPEGVDPGLQQMVVVGHSQGGLLAKLMAVESGDAFWRMIARRRINELDLAPESRALLERSLFFEPLPFVRRVVFMATPHRGSQLAEHRLASWLSRLVKLPATLSLAVFELATHGNDALYLSVLDRMPTSLDNMAANDRFLRTLAGLPIAPGIGSNSIIAVRGSGPYREGTDGVVRFTSADLAGVDSQRVVQPAGHSVQMHQEAIQELRRILREHAAAE